MFDSLSEIVKGKTCDENMTFSELSIRGLGFKLVINCDNCRQRYINFCSLIQNTYEINRRIIFAMRLLGIDYVRIISYLELLRDWKLSEA